MSNNLQAQRPRVTEVVRSQAERRKRIVIVGDGIAGIAAAHALRRRLSSLRLQRRLAHDPTDGKGRLADYPLARSSIPGTSPTG